MDDRFATARQHFTPEQRAALLGDFDTSGLSAAEFCRQRNLVYATFMRWRTNQRAEINSERGVEVRTHAPVAQVFRHLELVPGPDASLAGWEQQLWAEVRLPSGKMVRILEGCPMALAFGLAGERP